MDDTRTAHAMTLGTQLFPHELQALLDALRRDLRMELSRAQTDANWAAYHYSNARFNMRLLELLEPRSPHGHVPFEHGPLCSGRTG